MCYRADRRGLSNQSFRSSNAARGLLQASTATLHPFCQDAAPVLSIGEADDNLCERVWHAVHLDLDVGAAVLVAVHAVSETEPAASEPAGIRCRSHRVKHDVDVEL